MIARIVLACTVLTFGAVLTFGLEEPQTSGQQKSGRIDGRILEFPKVEHLTPVRVRAIDLYVGDSGQRFATSEIDEQGRFVFENVPAGRVRLNPLFDVGPERKSATLFRALHLATTVREGETSELALFGKGRPLVGKLVLPDSVNPEHVRVGLEVPDPPTRGVLGRERSPDWDVHALLTAAPLESKVDAEGRFRIEGVREGNYRIWADIVDTEDRIIFSGADEPGYPPVVDGSLTVPFMRDGGSDEPFDLGSLEFEMAPSAGHP